MVASSNSYINVCSGFVDINNNLLTGYTCAKGYTPLTLTIANVATVSGCLSCNGLDGSSAL